MTPPDLPPGDASVFRSFYRSTRELELSHRQVELLTRLTRGLMRTQLAEEMSVSLATVDYHAKIIRAHTGHGPRELALRLMRAELLGEIGRKYAENFARGGQRAVACE